MGSAENCFVAVSAYFLIYWTMLPAVLGFQFPEQSPTMCSSGWH